LAWACAGKQFILQPHHNRQKYQSQQFRFSPNPQKLTVLGVLSGSLCQTKTALQLAWVCAGK
jgi:hypothetical protein